MGMTEYEVADLAASVMANFLTSLTVFLSIVSAYVISAFVSTTPTTSSRLTRTFCPEAPADHLRDYLLLSL